MFTLRLIGNRQLGSIWQISGEHNVSYSDAAYWGAKALKADLNLIQPCSTIDAGIDLEVNPANTPMDTERLK